MLRFQLRPWRRTGDDLEEGELAITKSVSDEELREYMGRLKSYEVVQARIRFDSDLQATLLEVLALEPDPELERRATELQVPPTAVVEPFGTLTFDRGLGWWETEHMWAETALRLYIGADEDADISAAAKGAEAFWQDQPEWDRRLRAKAVDDLLALKNESWLADDESPLSAEEFNARITPESVSFAEDRSFEFFFEDGGLFMGHTILVSGTLNDGPIDADIAG